MRKQKNISTEFRLKFSELLKDKATNYGDIESQLRDLTSYNDFVSLAIEANRFDIIEDLAKNKNDFLTKIGREIYSKLLNYKEEFMIKLLNNLTDSEVITFLLNYSINLENVNSTILLLNKRFKTNIFSGYKDIEQILETLDARYPTYCHNSTEGKIKVLAKDTSSLPDFDEIKWILDRADYSANSEEDQQKVKNYINENKLDKKLFLIIARKPEIKIDNLLEKTDIDIVDMLRIAVENENHDFVNQITAHKEAKVDLYLLKIAVEWKNYSQDVLERLLNVASDDILNQLSKHVHQAEVYHMYSDTKNIILKTIEDEIKKRNNLNKVEAELPPKTDSQEQFEGGNQNQGQTDQTENFIILEEIAGKNISNITDKDKLILEKFLNKMCKDGFNGELMSLTVKLMEKAIDLFDDEILSNFKMSNGIDNINIMYLAPFFCDLNTVKKLFNRNIIDIDSVDKFSILDTILNRKDNEGKAIAKFLLEKLKENNIDINPSIFAYMLREKREFLIDNIDLETYNHLYTKYHEYDMIYDGFSITDLLENHDAEIRKSFEEKSKNPQHNDASPTPSASVNSNNGVSPTPSAPTRNSGGSSPSKLAVSNKGKDANNTKSDESILRTTALTGALYAPKVIDYLAKNNPNVVTTGLSNIYNKIVNSFGTNVKKPVYIQAITPAQKILTNFSNMCRKALPIMVITACVIGIYSFAKNLNDGKTKAESAKTGAKDLGIAFVESSIGAIGGAGVSAIAAAFGATGVALTAIPVAASLASVYLATKAIDSFRSNSK